MDLTAAEKARYLKYAELALPRHTSYPTVPHWRPWPEAEHEAALAALGARLAAGRGRAGLYVHVPFCRQLCAYCGCNRVIVPDERRALHDPTDELLSGLALEARRVAALTGRQVLHQLHLGGGTPTFLTPAQLARLGEIIAANFSLAPDADAACEIDPRVTTRAHLAALRGLGFNRLSLGVQDFDARVQAAIRRIQPEAQVRQVVDWARELGFTSVNFDLIYGLPWQTEASLAATLEKVVELAPDRIAFFRLAVLPQLFKWQRSFRAADLPKGEASLALMLLAVRRFEAAGYRFIGLDHFAKRHDPLARALEAHDLSRSFQGMSPGRDVATIGLGPTAITDGLDFYAQNAHEMKAWTERVAGGLATVKGVPLTADDRARREVLRDLYAYGRTGGPDFWATYGHLRPTLEAMAAEGLVELQTSGLAVTPTLGRLLVRVVAAAFDRFVPPGAWKVGLASGQASAAG